MLGRRRHDVRAGDAVRETGSANGHRKLPAQRGPRRAEPTGFRLTEEVAGYPSTHPDHPGYEIFFSFERGGEVTITTPQYPGPAGPVFWVLDLPVAEWTRLVDQDGRSIPVELRFEEGLASARWC